MGISKEDLANTICDVVTATTGRPSWTKVGIQNAPRGPYATVYLLDGTGVPQDVIDLVEDVQDGVAVLREEVRGTEMIEVQIDFFRDGGPNDSAYGAATRFRNALQLSARFDDLWKVCGLSGGVKTMDISAAFRVDTEARARAQFMIYANISEPAPLPDSIINEITTQSVDLYREDAAETNFIKRVPEV